MERFSANQFQGVHMNDILFVEDLLTLNIVLYDIDIVDGNIIGELARRSVQKYENTVRLLRYASVSGHCLDSSCKSMECVSRKREFFLSQKENLTWNIFSHSELDLGFLVQEEQREERFLSEEKREE